jgi:hypothetical protein
MGVENIGNKGINNVFNQNKPSDGNTLSDKDMKELLKGEDEVASFDRRGCSAGGFFMGLDVVRAG